MASFSRTGAVLVLPSADHMGNLLWPGALPDEHQEALPEVIVSITDRGYWASALPECDGVTFKRQDDAPNDPNACLADFRATFGFLDIDVLDPDEGLASTLARLAGKQTVTCNYLVPVEGLHIEAPFALGETRFHAPVNGDDIRLADHAWDHLCDVPGADVDPGWAPGDHATGTTKLLGWPLIERKIDVPLAELYSARASFNGQSALLRRVMEDADHALDPVRFHLCHYRRLEYLPGKPGWIGDFAVAYVVPECRALQTCYLNGKPYVLRVSNNWLGLEIDDGALSLAEPLAAGIVDNKAGNEIRLALNGALRALNRAFYLAELEASFLHLAYAIDALCGPKGLRGDRHRLWISAFGSAGEKTRFAALVTDFDRHYSVRNRIVHEGETFAGMGLLGESHCQFMLEVLGSCIQTFLRNGFSTRREAAAFAFNVLASPAITQHLAAMGSTQFSLPLTADKAFSKHMRPWSG